MAIVAAHRGLSGSHAENTLAAFQAAIDAGFPAIELDVRPTADGEVVCMHDAGVDRTTDGSGRVEDMQYSEVSTLDTGEGPVPRLADVFDATSEWKGLWDVEIKGRGATRNAVHIIRSAGVRAIVASLDPRALREALEVAPEIPRALITLGPPDLEDLEVAKELQCTWLHADHDFLTLDAVERIRQGGLKVGAWTVNDSDRAMALEAHGVEMIITDFDEVRNAL